MGNFNAIYDDLGWAVCKQHDIDSGFESLLTNSEKKLTAANTEMHGALLLWLNTDE